MPSKSDKIPREGETIYVDWKVDNRVDCDDGDEYSRARVLDSTPVSCRRRDVIARGTLYYEESERWSAETHVVEFLSGFRVRTTASFPARDNTPSLLKHADPEFDFQRTESYEEQEEKNMSSAVQALQLCVDTLESKIQFVTRNAVDPQERVKDKLLADLRGRVAYALFQQLQNPVIGNDNGSIRKTREGNEKSRRGTKNSAKVSQDFSVGPLTCSYILARVDCSFRTFVSLCHNTNSLIAEYPCHRPFYLPCCPSKDLPSPQQDSYTIAYPLLQDFAHVMV